jgi:intracellular septation protein
VKSSISQKNFFLISFLPALAYWYLEENYPVSIAITGGLLLASLEMLLEKVFFKHIHKISKFNFILILFLGGLSLLGDEGMWFKLQPAITGMVVGIILFVGNISGKSLFVEMMSGFDKPLPPADIINPLEKHLSYLFFFYGIFMIWVATTRTTDVWLFYKTIGFYIAMAVFFVIEYFLLRFRLKTMVEKQKKREVLSRFRI